VQLQRLHNRMTGDCTSEKDRVGPISTEWRPHKAEFGTFGGRSWLFVGG